MSVKYFSVCGVHATPTGLKMGSKGRVQSPKEVLSQLPKRLRRKVRKAAFKMGRFDIARS